MLLKLWKRTKVVVLVNNLKGNNKKNSTLEKTIKLSSHFSPIETSQKEIRRIIRENARRDTLAHCLEDVLHFRMRWTNYLQRKLRAKKRKIVPDPLVSADDKLVASFFLDDEEEIPVEESNEGKCYSYS